jgi:PHD/YefM family antitoxin component YafN of YafNO toxin-antitoxin module
MAVVPISEFEHRVAKWIAHLEKTREPLEISQRGRTKLVALDKATFDELKADRARLQAIEIKLLVEEGERAFREGRFLTHEQVGQRLGLARPRRRRRR